MYVFIYVRMRVIWTLQVYKEARYLSASARPAVSIIITIHCAHVVITCEPLAVYVYTRTVYVRMMSNYTRFQSPDCRRIATRDIAHHLHLIPVHTHTHKHTGLWFRFEIKTNFICSHLQFIVNRVEHCILFLHWCTLTPPIISYNNAISINLGKVNFTNGSIVTIK